jgi:hypothetical protein
MGDSELPESPVLIGLLAAGRAPPSFPAPMEAALGCVGAVSTYLAAPLVKGEGAGVAPTIFASRRDE